MSAQTLPLGPLAQWLTRSVPGFAGLRELRQFSGGQSNPSYHLIADSGDYVLRAQPPGELLKSAHRVDREFRVMGALAGSAVPVPRVLAASGADGPLGRQFFVMGYLDGRVFWDPTLAALTVPARRRVYDELNRVLAAVHGLDPAAIGLADFGRPGDYFGRQLSVWTRQYRAAAEPPDAGMLQLIDWLARHLPPDDGQVALVHGDYRLDNLMFAREEESALALLDWELATLGHPMADLAYQCLQWRLPADGAMRGLGGVDRGALGLPTEADYVARYCERRAIEPPRQWSFYIAFSCFRLAAILAGVYRRYRDGNASNPATARRYGQAVPQLIAMALTEIDTGAAR